MAFSKLTLQSIWDRLLAAAYDAGLTLERTAFSSIVRDAKDYACGIFDQRGRLVAMNAQATPGLFGGLDTMLKGALDSVFASAVPGDVFICNDPWMGSGHLNDVFIGQPIFYRGRIVGYAVAVVHHTDIGGRGPTTASRTIFEEGLQIPMTLLCSADRYVAPVHAFIARNIAASATVFGDLKAQQAALSRMQDRVCDVLQDNGLESLEDIADAIIGLTEDSTRRAIRAIPDGQYHSVLKLDYLDGESGQKATVEKLELHVRIDVTGDRLLVDFSGTSPQVARAINATMNFTRSYTLFAIKCLTTPDLPNNAGAMAAVTIEAQPGSVLNATYPASVWSRTAIGHFVPELIFSALADVLPDKVPAASGSTPVWLQAIRGRRRNGAAFSAYHMFQGGFGGSAHGDGRACLSFPHNVANEPIELLEQGRPLLFLRKELREDSGGAGMHRGGAGQEIVFQLLPDVAGEVVLSVRGGRFNHDVPGLHGGHPAAPAELAVNERAVRTGQDLILGAGDVVTTRTQGGGGYGNPRRRDRQKLLADIRAGLVSAAAAEAVYGLGGKSPAEITPSQPDEPQVTAGLNAVREISGAAI